LRILIGIWHPAHVHIFKNLIRELKKRKHKIKVVVIKKDIVLELLDSEKIDYEVIGKSSSIVHKNVNKIFTHSKSFIDLLEIIKKFKPDFVFDRGYPPLIHLSKVFKISHFIFSDDDIKSFFKKYLFSLTDGIITPKNYEINFRKNNHFKLPTFKELSYLHPNNFSPDKSLLREEGLDPDEKYSIIRFVNWEAWHDVGKKGFNREQKVNLVKTLDKYSEVYISVEGDVPDELKDYVLDFPIDKIHNVLYHANIFVGDSQTMATEAAVLGVPTVRHNMFVGEEDMSNFIELENEYGLLYNFEDSEKATRKAVELIQDAKMKERWVKKREKLLKEKIDLSAFLIWFIDNYPESVNQLEENKDIIWEVSQ